MSGNRFRYRKINVRDSAVLTTSYVAATLNDPEDSSTKLELYDLNQLVLLVDFTIGSLTTAEIKIEFSPDGTDWYQEISTSTSSGTITVSAAEYTFSATGKYRIAVPTIDRFIRISAKGTGTVTNSLMEIDAVIGRS